MSEQDPTQRSKSPREILDSMQTPTNANEALALLLVVEASAIEEGRTTTQEAIERLKGTFKDAQKKASER